MRPSMWTSYLVEWMPREMVKVFAEHGWQWLELSDEHGHDLLKEGDPLKVGEGFRRYVADLGVSFPQGHFYLATKGMRPEDIEGRRTADIAPPDETAFAEAMDDMKRWVDLFSALGVEAGVLHVGGDALPAAGWSRERIFARRVEAVRTVAEYAKSGPTELCLENLGTEGANTAGEMLEIVEAVGTGNVALCLDTGHANITGVDSAAFIREAGGSLKALHIADNLGQNDDHMLPYGRGTVRWPEVMEALREVGYAGLFNFEVPGENHCPEPVRLAKLDYALKLARWMIADDGR